VVYTVEVVDPRDTGGTLAGVVDGAFAETGHTVVYKLMISVVTEPTGQLVTVGAQLVMV